ncbi:MULTISPECIES: amino acid ABC transporter ATP-binding protein [unclassified Shinella]|uniref:amino acid ABC transporter ATP-binding protein n=1 Tax=unclassified Shinella TaxID=2643062 RepID=UPI00225C72E1|nr:MULTISPECIES: amino acid ABC transporter ATP-binding protein [unclassified Shinella]MCO5137596.1 amino acid ABC transporter ATP-binding protein [Shinella sp.]MDC7257714.1 amino acid ABC transporter ATP-binding protein [Shinella sp. YE25]CAI0335544.1 cystine ABC transporter ATP binding subunit [Rhizobiaceae bacterium]CAK7259849.1 cystine ABC transporter ATP binding subunit [Shinella sp. WSC3-e]
MTTSQTAMIDITGLRKSFGPLEVLKDINLQVKAGGVVALLGPSGSGKSTLLRCMNLLVVPDAGRIRVGDTTFQFGASTERPRTKPLAAFRSRTGMVFQNFNLFPHMTVLENVIEAPIHVRRLDRKTAIDLGMSQLEKVGLADRASQRPQTLSGGQKQRVAIARALAMEPSVMLFDEATSALDPELVGEVLQTMQQLAADGMTMVIVTHEIAFARDVADRVVFMRDGYVVEEGPAGEVINTPRMEATKTFLSHFHKGAI